MNMQCDVKLKKCQLSINVITTTYDAVCTIWSLTLCQFLSLCIVVLEESLLWGCDTASLGSWFATALCYNIFEPVTQ